MSASTCIQWTWLWMCRFLQAHNLFQIQIVFISQRQSTGPFLISALQMSTNLIKVHFNSESPECKICLCMATNSNSVCCTFLLGRQPSPPKGFSNSNTAISVQSQLHKLSAGPHLAMIKHRQTHKVKTTPAFIRKIRLRFTTGLNRSINKAD